MLDKVMIVITSINKPDAKLIKYKDLYPGSEIIWIGDTKTPPIDVEWIDYYNIDKQKLAFDKLSNLLPICHYGRKNIGYVLARNKGYKYVLDTDDDNFPKDKYSSFPPFEIDVEVLSVNEGKGLNIYKNFEGGYSWPRGLRLDREFEIGVNTGVSKTKIGCWQGLADIEPDVDAIYRLAQLPNVTFNNSGPYAIKQNNFVPFNSQNTLWQIDNLEMAYIPCTVTFRFCDILRGYVAQRIFWEKGQLVGFISANVYQDRNEHNLLNDLESELIMYKTIPLLESILNNIQLSGSNKDMMLQIYRKLVESNIVNEDEIYILEAYLECF